MVKPPGDQPTPRLTKESERPMKRMATVAAVFTRTPWVRTPQQVVESLFRIYRTTPEDATVPPRPENKRVWASLLKSKNAVIQEVAEEMARRDPSASKIRVALTDGERRLQFNRPEAEVHPDSGLDARSWRNCGKLPMSSMPRVAWEPNSGSSTAPCESCSVMSARSSRNTSKSHQTRPVRGGGRNAAGSCASTYRNRTRMRYDEYLANS